MKENLPVKGGWGGAGLYKQTLLSDAGQFYREYRLSIGCTDDRDITPVCVCYGQGNRETKPGARRWSFHGIVHGYMLTSIETLKNMREILWMDTFAVINHLDQRVTILPVELELNPTVRRWASIFYRVIE